MKASPADARRHWLARLEDGWQAWRQRRGLRRGLVPTVIPFAGYGTEDWVRVLGRVVLRRPGAAPVDRFTNIRGWRSFISIPLGDIEVEVVAGGEQRTIRSDRGGVLDATIQVRMPRGWVAITLRAAGDEAEAPVFVVEDGVGFGVVSDVDDTVMVTALPRPLLAAWNTFVLDEHARRPVPGMAVLYTRLQQAHPGAPFIYLSTGAWNVVPTLTRFLERNLYPRGSLLLTDWGPTHDRWFRSGSAHKAESLERLATEFPRMRWLLIGDDGQHDEQIYGDFATAHPGNVAAVAIRRLTPGEAVLAGGRSDAETHDLGRTRWVYGDDGAALMVKLENLGLLPTGPA
ncbi:App1 family protein [Lysinimonas soli]|uniref:App1 family protein n=1 Tax=Lysinimonas soli TaxID=1074233 RepID=A0ABW0NRG1_9MICO